jgi:uncharacterized protein (DUF433 family)
MKFIQLEVLEGVLNMYVQGVSIEDICDMLRMSPDEVNEILDCYAPHL